MHSRLVKPKVSEVKEWFLMADESTPSAKVYYADIDQAFIRVMPNPTLGKVKYFYGENSWSDSRRYAYDIHFKELYK
jgi:hypothetical protein